jgi:hypothetical protein
MSIPKGCILYNSIYITVLKGQNYRSGEKISGYKGLRRRCRWKRNMGGFTASKGFFW